MPLETVIHIGDLVATNPTEADPKSQGDNHIRNLKTALANDFAGFTGAVCVAGIDGGTVNAYTLTTNTALPAYGTKMAAVIAPTVTNTGAATLNISGLGPRAIKRVDGTDVIGGELAAGLLYALLYTGTEWRLPSISKQYADQLAYAAAVPAQPGGPAPYYLTSVNGVAAWSSQPVAAAVYAYNNFGGF